MSNFEKPQDQKFEQDLSDERIKEIDKEIQELETAKEQAVDSILLVSKKKKKGKKTEMQKIELPDNPQTREIDFIKDDKGRFHFEFTDSEGNQVIASPGDLIADMQWGIYYDLNHEIKSSDHRSKYDKFRKKYLAAAYQTKIDKLQTEKLLMQRLKMPNLEHYLSEIYKELYQDLKTGVTEKEQAGFIFEKMINGLLTKISVDLGEQYGFEVEPADVIDDVELKADLIVKFLASKRGDRGVGAGENDQVKGFQLTLIDKNDKRWQHKKDQVQKIKQDISKGKVTEIDDLVLLETGVGNREVMSRYEKWQQRGKFAGGPENLFSVSQIMEFLKKVFEKTDLDFAKNRSFESAVSNYFEKYG